LVTLQEAPLAPPRHSCLGRSVLAQIPYPLARCSSISPSPDGPDSGARVESRKAPWWQVARGPWSVGASSLRKPARFRSARSDCRAGVIQRGVGTVRSQFDGSGALFSSHYLGGVSGSTPLEPRRNLSRSARRSAKLQPLRVTSTPSRSAPLDRPALDAAEMALLRIASAM